jgi:hypothetical protein
MMKSLKSLVTSALLAATLASCTAPGEFDVVITEGSTDSQGLVSFIDVGGREGQVEGHVFEEQSAEDLSGAIVTYFDNAQKYSTAPNAKPFEVFFVQENEANGARNTHTNAPRFFPFLQNEGFKHEMPLTGSPYWQLFDAESERNSARHFVEYAVESPHVFAHETCEDRNMDPSFLQGLGRDVAMFIYTGIQAATPVGFISSAAHNAREIHDVLIGEDMFRDYETYSAILYYSLAVDTDFSNNANTAATAGMRVALGINVSCEDFYAGGELTEGIVPSNEVPNSNDDTDDPFLDECLICDNFDTFNTAIWPDVYGATPTAINGWLTLNSSQTTTIDSSIRPFSGQGYVLELSLIARNSFDVHIAYPQAEAGIFLSNIQTPNTSTLRGYCYNSGEQDISEVIYEGDAIDVGVAQRIRLEHATNGTIGLQINGNTLNISSNCSLLPSASGNILASLTSDRNTQGPLEIDYFLLRE